MSASSARSSGSSSVWGRSIYVYHCGGGVRPLERRGLLRDALAHQRHRHEERHPSAGASEVPAHPLLLVGGLRRLAGADGRVCDGRVRDQADERLRDDEVGQRDADPQLGHPVRHRVGRRAALQHLRAGRVLQPLPLGQLPLPLLRADGPAVHGLPRPLPHFDLPRRHGPHARQHLATTSSPAKPTTSAASTTTRSRSCPTSC